MKHYPALDVQSTSDMVLALADDFAPSAAESRDGSTRLFFSSPAARDEALTTLRAGGYVVQPIDVPDEDWARRSQADLAPVTVGRITVVAPWHLAPGHLLVVIAPSMGFGTGHHETTRLCLEALQTIDLNGATMLDVGTGSGVLAIAADRLGATQALGIDNDADAIQSARENLALNPSARHTAFEVADVAGLAPNAADVVAANLTGALLIRVADTLIAAVRVGGILILSGVLSEEYDAVRKAFDGLEPLWHRHDGEWVGLILKKR